jgi:hypothetical protein
LFYPHCVRETGEVRVPGTGEEERRQARTPLTPPLSKGGGEGARRMAARQLVTQAEFIQMIYHRAKHKVSRGARGRDDVLLSPMEAAALMMVLREHEHRRRKRELLGVAE